MLTRIGRSRRFTVVIIGLLASLVIGACGRSDEPTQTGQDAASQDIAIAVPESNDDDFTPNASGAPAEQPQDTGSATTLNEQLEEASSTSDDSGSAFRYVVKLYVSDCSGLPSKGSYQLTGTFVAGFEGIVTALHGVIHCAEWDHGRLCVAATMAEPYESDAEAVLYTREYSCLEILEVDIDRDLAHLASTDLSRDRQGGNWPAGGLQPQVQTAGNMAATDIEAFECGGTVDEPYFFQVPGYPGATAAGKTRYAIFECVRPLRELLTDYTQIDFATLGYLNTRSSPSLGTKVISIQNEAIQPGDSGAPLLEPRDHALHGIILGGIPNSQSLTQWAAPWSQLHWSSVSDNQTRSRLTGLMSPLSWMENAPSTSIFFGFGDKTIVMDTYKIWIDQMTEWGNELEVNVSSVDDACITVLSHDYYARSPERHRVLVQRSFYGAEGSQKVIVPMIKFRDTPTETYRRFCSNAANSGTVEFYAYLYRLEDGKCKRPLADMNGLVYQHVSIAVPQDQVWEFGFCAHLPIQ